MKVLLGFGNHIPEVLYEKRVPGSIHEIVCFGREQGHFAWHPAMTWKELLAACPAGWKPDVYIHWSPEYNPVPVGLEEADCLTVGVAGDWNLGGRALYAIRGVFDLYFADKPGMQTLQRLGLNPVEHGLLWGYHPELHRTLPHSSYSTRDIDVLLIGNLNHAVQKKRAYWLARVASLSNRWRILITGGVYGEEYVSLMNRARVVFNHSIRGEANMRAYEGTACGAVVLNEEGNEELRGIFAPGEDYLEYNTDNLEEVLTGILNPDSRELWEKVSLSGREKTIPHTYAGHLKAMLDVVQARLQEGHERHREFALLSAAEKRNRIILQWYCCNVPESLLESERLLGASSSEGGEQNRQNTALRAVVCGQLCTMENEPSALQTRSLKLANHAVQLDPANQLMPFNLAYLYYLQKDYTDARLLLESMAARQEDAAEFSPYLPLLSRDWREEDVAQDALWGEFVPNSPAWQQQMQRLLKRRTYSLLGALQMEGHEYEAAEQSFALALTESAENPDLLYQHARALAATGRVQEALHCYRQAVHLQPFYVEARMEAAAMAADTGRSAEAVESMEEWLRIIDAVPAYSSVAGAARQLLSYARTQMQTTKQPAGKRILAIPDLADQREWQQVLRWYVENHSCEEGALLMLRAEPHAIRDTRSFMLDMTDYLQSLTGLSMRHLPAIVLLNQPVAALERWRLFYAADAVLETSCLGQQDRVIVQAMGLTLLQAHAPTLSFTAG